jgi:hypothetical protein
VTRTGVGVGTLTFRDQDNGTFSYLVKGVQQTKPLARYAFGPVPTCTYEARPDFAAATNYQDLWWVADGAESGWGINLTHQGDTIFATWFTYDVADKAWWLSVVAGRQPDGTYAGDLVQTSGPPVTSVPFDPGRVSMKTVGSGKLAFTDENTGSFAYTVNGTTQTKAITREVFGPIPTCRYGASPAVLALSLNYQDLWWVPNAAESGWGINLTHQGDMIFATWFTYDLDGTPLWLVATAKRQPTGIYKGALYRTTGPAFSAVPFNPAAVSASPVGDVKLAFQHGSAGALTYFQRDAIRFTPTKTCGS